MLFRSESRFLPSHLPSRNLPGPSRIAAFLIEAVSGSFPLPVSLPRTFPDLPGLRLFAKVVFLGAVSSASGNHNKIKSLYFYKQGGFRMPSYIYADVGGTSGTGNQSANAETPQQQATSLQPQLQTTSLLM